MKYSIPNKENFCGGNFQDWLEVNLTEKCNGKCSWCIEKKGFHPKEHAKWHEIADKAVNTNKSNIILLGGEPTLHKDIAKIITYLYIAGRKIYITTNGGMLNPEFIRCNLKRTTGINISIHDSDLKENKKITGVNLKDLADNIAILHSLKISVRLNCNCIKEHVDSAEAINKYIKFAKAVGADKIRFAELKLADNKFVDLAKILNYKYGLNDDPFVHGCNKDTVINGMPVNFRQMCGIQTSLRKKPLNPKQYPKQVLYYDGKIYDGWQTKGTIKKEDSMTEPQINKLLKDVAAGKITAEAAAKKIKAAQEEIASESRLQGASSVGGGCRY